MKKFAFLLAALVLAGCEGSGSSGGGGNQNPNPAGNNGGGNNGGNNGGGFNNGGNNGGANAGIVGNWAEKNLPAKYKSSVYTVTTQSVTWTVTCQDNEQAIVTAPATVTQTHLTILESREAPQNNCFPASLEQGMTEYNIQGNALQLGSGNEALTLQRN